MQDQLQIFNKWQNMFIKEKKTLNMAKSTIYNYSIILNKLYDYYSKHEDKIAFYNIDREFILNFINDNDDLSINTKNLHITVIKSFFKFVSKYSDEDIDFVKRFTDLTAKAKKSDPVALNSYEYDILVKYLKSPVKPSSFIQYRNRLTLKLLLFTGIRASEVLGIKFSDFLYLKEEGVYKVNILGKGNKERYVYIKHESIEDELEYVKSYIKNNITKSPQNGKSEDSNTYINLTSKGRVLLRGELYSMVTNTFKKLNINKKGVHILRHTFGKKMVQKNVNLSTIKELMGHENIQTTMIYARSDEDSMILAIS